MTLPAVELLPVTRLFDRCRDDQEFREELFSKGSGRLLYEVLDDLFDYCFPILDKIGHKLDSLEDDVFEGRSEEVVRDISNVKQEIISYRKIIKPERSTLRLLERHVERFLPEELELYFDDIVDAAERIWDILDNYKEVVEALEDTNESVISHRQNDVLRILTVFSVVLLPLTLITGFFGMNVHFPGYETVGVLGDLRRHGRVAHRPARVLPVQALALTWAAEGVVRNHSIEGVRSRLRREPCYCTIGSRAIGTRLSWSSDEDRRGGAVAAAAPPLSSCDYARPMPEPLWAPWRLEYVQHADELDRCIFCEPEEELLIHRGAKRS